MWLVGSKPIRSNVTIPATSFLHKFLHKWHNVPCIMMSSIITSPSILNIWRHGGLTALKFELIRWFLYSYWQSAPKTGCKIKAKNTKSLLPGDIFAYTLFTIFQRRKGGGGWGNWWVHGGMDISRINNVFVYNENQLTLSRPSLLISTLRKRVHRILRSMNAITLMLLRLKLCPISSKMDFTSLVIASTLSFLSSAVWNRIIRAIFVWPWNESARTKQKQQMNGNRAIWLVYRTDRQTRLAFHWLSECSGEKTSCPRAF